MTNLGSNQENKFEALRKQSESLSGGLEVLISRFNIVEHATYNALISPTTQQARENAYQANERLNAQNYQKLVNEAALLANQAPVYAEPTPIAAVSEEAILATPVDDARVLLQNIHAQQTPVVQEDDHNFTLAG